MLDVSKQVQLAVFLEWMGVQRLWLPDHLAFPYWEQSPEVWTVMTAIAARTRRVSIGTGVSDPHRIPPAVFAQRAATLDQLSRGRVIIGLGSGEAMNVVPYGIAWDRRVTRLMESVTIIRGLLDSPDPFTFEGSIYQLRGGRLTIRPYKERRIPIYLAALGPKMQRFCGEVCDGWYPVIIPPDHYAHYYGPIDEAARNAGRSPHAVDRVALIPFALVDNERAMYPQVVKAARQHALTLVWPPVLERMGMPLSPPAHLAGFDYISVNPADETSVARFKDMAEWIPEEILMKFLFYGNMHTLKRVVGQYIDAGASSINLINVSPDPLESTVRISTELLPHFTRRRPTLSARVARAGMPVLKRLVKIPKVDRTVLAAEEI